jgi:5-hydroxyisourate hydrolase-like protein (transthyretin family)
MKIQDLLSINYSNPGTKIKFQITASTQRNTVDVKLKVYNILGNEIATLVNNKMQPGIYEVQFNANQLPSGVYFYKLTAGNYSETKKMMLIK